MQPKIGYLVNDNAGWDDEDPNWCFYEENEVPRYKIEHASKGSYKRIVYWEIDDDRG